MVNNCHDDIRCVESRNESYTVLATYVLHSMPINVVHDSHSVQLLGLSFSFKEELNDSTWPKGEVIICTTDINYALIHISLPVQLAIITYCTNWVV